ncbi:MAG: transcriptional regulator BetI [Phyllobacteriaceae bacterium]|nr:transcriptional regulator BetI [Phyllobacteriaceae bacterium]
MPRIGAEPERRKALIHAAIDVIGEHGSLDVPVKVIAEQAGMSPALAFHYFGHKDEIIVETMRYLLRELSNSVVAELQRAQTPFDRIDGIIRSSFAPGQFDRKTIAAWLVFYLKAYSAPAAARLLTIYFRRFESNLVGAFRQLLDDPGSVATGKEAMELAEGLGALIDGLYIREALGAREPDAYRAIELCRRHVDAALGRIGIESGLAARIEASRSGQPGHGSPATGGVH